MWKEERESHRIWGIFQGEKKVEEAVGGILSERLARGHENLTRIGRNRGEPGRPSEKIRKKCLTNASARDKINEFESRDKNEFEKD